MPPDTVFVFDTFRLNPARRLLLDGDAALSLGGRAFDVLVALVRRRGELAGKAELMNEVWPDVVVEENNLTTQIVTLRKLLRQAPPDRQLIVTVPGRGYRFVWPVTLEAPGTSDALTAPAAPIGAGIPAGPMHNLPLESNSFIGRERELADIAARLAERKLVTLVGSGGVGKTRVAIRAARAALADYADGVWLLELAPLTDPALVAETLCRLLGIPVSGERNPTDIAIGFLRQKTLLLLLDNCEHLAAETARLAAALLAHCPNVTILATSRSQLGIHGETIYRMPSLPLPEAHPRLTAEQALRSEAVRLFVDRAADAAGGYVLTDEDAPSVAMICRRLDGVAMATELAAARLRLLKPAEIAARLEDVFRLLTGGSKAVLPRQQTLRATIDWSHALLSESEQVVLRRLSVFVDHFTLDGAAAVAAGDGIEADDVMDLLAALVDKSLISAASWGSATRFGMLNTTRHYALEKLAGSGDAGCERRMAEYLARVCARAEQSWATTATDAWIAAFGPEVENLRAAIDWAFGVSGDAELGLVLVANAGSLTEELSLQAAMRRWTQTALPHLHPGTPPGIAAWVLYWAQRHQGVRSTGEILQTRRRAIALFRCSNDTVGLACALRTTAIASVRPGETTEEAFAQMREALALLEPRGNTKDHASAIGHMGSLHYIHGDLTQARDYNERALAMRRQLGDRSGELTSYVNLAELEAASGDIPAAVEYALRSIQEARSRHVLGVLAVTLGNLSGYRLAIDDVPGSISVAREALRLNRGLGYTDYAVICLEHLALAAALSGNLPVAAQLYGFTDAHYSRTDQVRDRLEQAGANRLLALLTAGLPGADVARLMARGASCTAEQADMHAADWAAEKPQIEIHA